MAFALGATATSAIPNASDPTGGVPIPDSLRGRSGALRLRIVRPADLAVEPGNPSIISASLTGLLGDSALRRPAAWTVTDSATGRPFHFITLIPFEAKREERVGSYRVGRWPAELRAPLSEAYRLPPGFIAVTEQNQHLAVSTHFQLRDFLSREQANIWPKPLVLDERLVDKLELLIDALRSEGHAVDGLTILSGFRTPRANARGANSGQSSESRHQYGDAADLIVDTDGNGRMDDLTLDGRVDYRDALVLVRLVNRIESAHPDLAGGTGVYRGTPTSGPFIHVDARGKRVRWGSP